METGEEEIDPRSVTNITKSLVWSLSYYGKIVHAKLCRALILACKRTINSLTVKENQFA